MKEIREFAAEDTAGRQDCTGEESAGEVSVTELWENRKDEAKQEKLRQCFRPCLCCLSD